MALTPREREVLSLIGEGQTNSEIAQRLGIALATVRNYIHGYEGTTRASVGIYAKIGTRNRAEAVRWWWTDGGGAAAKPDGNDPAKERIPNG